MLVLSAFVMLIGTDSAVVLAQEKGVVIPPPAADESAGEKSSEVAVVAGGCFWGVQGVYQHVKGVTAAVSGYAGGQKNTAQYETVGRGGSGHAESVQITFDPRQVSYGRLLQVFFSVVHDPTQLNRQGPDVGTAVPLGDFPGQSRAGQNRTGVHRPVEPGARVQGRDRDQDRTGPAVLPSRGLPSGLPEEKSEASLHRHQRSTKNRRAEEGVPRSLSICASARELALDAGDRHRRKSTRARSGPSRVCRSRCPRWRRSICPGGLPST